LTWLAGFEADTVENIAAVITRARQMPEGDGSNLADTSSPRFRPGVAPWGIGGEPARRGLLVVDADDEARTIGRRVRQIRNTRGKSLRTIAELAGISASHLHRSRPGSARWTAAPRPWRWPTRYKSPLQS
jgi:hypothetical protein